MASRRLGASVQSDRVKHLLIAPPLLFLLLLSLIPLLLTLGLSLTSMDISGKGRWIGVDNYIRLADDPIFIESYVNTLIFVAIGLPIQYFLGLGPRDPGARHAGRAAAVAPHHSHPLDGGAAGHRLHLEDDLRFPLRPGERRDHCLGRQRCALDYRQGARLHLDPRGRHLAVDALRLPDPLCGPAHAAGRALRGRPRRRRVALADVLGRDIPNADPGERRGDPAARDRGLQDLRHRLLHHRRRPRHGHHHDHAHRLLHRVALGLRGLWRRHGVHPLPHRRHLRLCAAALRWPAGEPAQQGAPARAGAGRRSLRPAPPAELRHECGRRGAQARRQRALSHALDLGSVRALPRLLDGGHRLQEAQGHLPGAVLRAGGGLRADLQGLEIPRRRGAGRLPARARQQRPLRLGQRLPRRRDRCLRGLWAWPATSTSTPG